MADSIERSAPAAAEAAAPTAEATAPTAEAAAPAAEATAAPAETVSPEVVSAELLTRLGSLRVNTALVELLLCRRVPILSALTVLWIVLPRVSAALHVRCVLLGDVRRVHVIREATVVVHVDVDVAVTPITRTIHGRAYSHADTEG